jgi:hypothetical protein
MSDLTIVFDRFTPSAVVAAMESSIRTLAPAAQINSIDLAALNPSTTAPANSCWLTFNPDREIDRICQDLSGLRQLAADVTGVKTGDGGKLWLPVIWTARGPIYGEVIAQLDTGDDRQPHHLDDAARQPLYSFAYRLLDRLAAPPAVYLIQYQSLGATDFSFDRLFPFPTAAALASIDQQQPHLFDCHWLCLTQQPILDVFVSS